VFKKKNINFLVFDRASIFVAALVVGLTIFMAEESDVTVANAFDNAIVILKSFAVRSQQADHYHRILENFKEDINKRRTQILCRKRKLSTRPVHKMFHLDRNVGGGGDRDEDAADNQQVELSIREQSSDGNPEGTVQTELVSWVSMLGWDDLTEFPDWTNFACGPWEELESS
jgi:hypothetical protein